MAGAGRKCEYAYCRVIRNKGAAGVDGMTCVELKDHLKAHWAVIREKLLSGDYIPMAVRKVEISKPQGGTRCLGVPTVQDRLIQQALVQVTTTSISGRLLYSWETNPKAPGH